jgi:hypothetical protein
MGIFGGEPKAEPTPKVFANKTDVEPVQPATGVAVTPDTTTAFRAEQARLALAAARGGEAQTAGLAVTAEETARGETAGQDSESAFHTAMAEAAKRTPDQAEKQQIDEIIKKIQDVNAQLDNRVAAETTLKDGSKILVFTKGAIQPESTGGNWVYFNTGKDGPGLTRLSDAGATKMESFLRHETEDTSAINDLIEQNSSPAKGGEMKYWKASYVASRNEAVVIKQKEISDKAQRTEELKDAHNLVSEPIDINAAPPAVGPTV